MAFETVGSEPINVNFTANNKEEAYEPSSVSFKSFVMLTVVRKSFAKGNRGFEPKYIFVFLKKSYRTHRRSQDF